MACSLLETFTEQVFNLVAVTFYRVNNGCHTVSMNSVTFSYWDLNLNTRFTLLPNLLNNVFLVSAIF